MSTSTASRPTRSGARPAAPSTAATAAARRSSSRRASRPRDVIDGQYDIEKYVLVNQPSPYVSTTYDHDLYKTWWKSGYNYYIDAPGGVDVNRTIGDTHKWADQVEVAFPGGIDRKYIIGVCPVNKTTKVEIMSGCQSNPHFEAWH